MGFPAKVYFDEHSVEPKSEPSRAGSAISREFVVFCTDVLVLLLIPLLLGQLVQRSAFRVLDGDEGLNLMKVSLSSAGFELYRDIWSDQPPFFTLFLRGWFEFFSLSLTTARYAVVFFASLLVWSLYTSVRLLQGMLASVVCVTFLLLSTGFFTYSVSIMIGMPALALSSLGILSAIVSVQGRKDQWAFVSGMFIAFAVLTKLFGVFAMLPCVLCFLLLDQHPWKERRRTIGSWILGGILAGSVIAIAGAPYIFSEVHQLLDSHLGVQSIPMLTGWRRLAQLLERETFFVALATFGFATSVLRNDRRIWIPAAWLAAGVVFVVRHNPVWEHHILLLTIPGAWLAGVGVSNASTIASEISSRRVRAFSQSAIIGTLLIAFMLIGERGTRLFQFVLREGYSVHTPLVQVMKRYSHRTKVVFSDLPVYPFLAGLRMDPRLGVMSEKRLRSGVLEQREILALIKHNRPEQILLGRFPKLRKHIIRETSGEYHPVYQRRGYLLLIRNDVTK